ncbi:hypothetical protein BS47DRAFT_1335904 [Hydnum rufescens UP504]|uniref:Peroxin-5 n=1 Tax=Hydnum rufescens UP504 TaxID=1448309 RepID=A0A9P6BAK2_9AGAM|nr:hypothetical protein BS47DRAFT_1335904 [Hydnum rufescens UP504]
MSLPALINGAECGPVNPLQGLSKQLDQDRGAQQDHFGSSSRAGPSRPTFRTQNQHPEHQPIFSNVRPFAQPAGPPQFDLSSLSIALPNVAATQMQPNNQHLSLASISNTPMAWAMDFSRANASQSPHTQGQMVVANKDPSLRVGPPSFWGTDFGQFMEMTSPKAWPTAQDLVVSNGNNAWINNQTYIDMRRDPTSMQFPMMRIQNQDQKGAVSSGWAEKFASIDEEVLPAPTSVPLAEVQQESQSRSATTTNPASVTVEDLSATAGLLIDSVQHANNPKFEKSEFMGLMKRLRDRKVVVEGNDMVDSDTHASYASGTVWADEFSTSMPSTSINGTVDKGKGRAADDVDASGVEARMGLSGFEDTVSPQFRPLGTPLTSVGNVVGGSERSAVSESQSKEAFRQIFDDINPLNRSPLESGLSQQEDEEDETVLLGKDYLRAESSRTAHLAGEWGRLQADWDNFEATTTGIVQTASSSYAFQKNNPYTRPDEAVTHERSPLQSVLEAEAVVQSDPNNASAWFELGVKQQENEREDQAIQALEMAVSLNPTYLDAWLALRASLAAIRLWVNANKPYAGAVEAHKSLNDDAIVLARMGGIKEKQNELVECLMTMARMSPHEGIDADIQIGLGVLLNMGEEYSKAQDCFQTALAVRPGDWLLYNRVGATLANSGRASEALDYYYRALELNPTYIRARFNLGISYVNLRSFDDAARHILDALVLQENDPLRDAGRSGPSSSTLWDTLKSICLYLQRPDLVPLCDAKDLGAFRSQFQDIGTPSSQGNDLSASANYDSLV